MEQELQLFLALDVNPDFLKVQSLPTIAVVSVVFYNIWYDCKLLQTSTQDSDEYIIRFDRFMYQWVRYIKLISLFFSFYYYTIITYLN